MADNPDAGLYPQFTPPQAAQPLGAQIAQLAQVRNAMNQNVAFQQQQAYQQAIGPILQQTVDPTTGQPDYNKAYALVASNPATSRFAPEFFSQGLANQKVQADTANNYLGQHITKMNTGLQIMQGLLSKGPAVTMGDVAQGLAPAVSNGVFSPQEATSMMGQLPPGGQPLFDRIRQATLQQMPALAAAQTVYGTQSNADVGGHVQTIQNSPFMQSAGPVGVPLTKGPSPESLNQGVGVTGPTGVPSIQPAGLAHVMLDGDNHVINPGVQPATTGLNPQSSFVANDYNKDLTSRAQGSQTAIQNFDQALSLLKSGVGGPGSPARAQLAQNLVAIGLPKETAETLTSGNITDTTELQKYLYTGAFGALQQSLGSNRMTNDEVMQAQKMLPNASTDPKAAQAVIGYMHHLAELPLAEQQQFQNFQTQLAQPGSALVKEGLTLGSWPSIWSKIMQARMKLSPGTTAAMATPGDQANGQALNGGAPAQ